MISAIKWNFSKFLVNRQGIPVKRYSPTASPMNVNLFLDKIMFFMLSFQDCMKDIEEELSK